MAKRKRRLPRAFPPGAPRPAPARQPEGTSRPARPAAPWLYGVHAVLAAVANPLRRCHRLVLTANTRDALKERLAQAVAAADGRRPQPEIAARSDIDRLLPAGAVHQGIALLADPLPPVAIEEVAERAAAETAVVVLDRASDPHNVGAVLRSAAAFGASAVVVTDRHAPEVTGALAKAASGALETVPLVRVANLARAMGLLKESGFWCVGLDPEAPQTLADAQLAGKVALVLGAEGEGMRRLTRETCDLLVRIPIAAGSDSLNLSNAAAVALYELARRRPPGTVIP